MNEKTKVVMGMVAGHWCSWLDKTGEVICEEATTRRGCYFSTMAHLQEMIGSKLYDDAAIWDKFSINVEPGLELAI